MALIEWTDEFSVGVDVLDDDHKMLIGMINELHDTSNEGRGLELVDKIFDQLEDYAHMHLSREESLMKSSGYAGYEEHKLAHVEWVKRLRGFKDKYQKENMILAHVEMSQFLQSWLVDHIRGVDFLYREHFKEKEYK